MRTIRTLITGLATVTLLAGSAVGAAAGAGASASAQSSGPSAAAVREALPSAGCGTSAAGAGTTLGAMDVADLTRSWSLHVPAAHDGHTPLPLVIQMHGYQESASVQADTSGLDALGDEHGFVTATPEGRGVMYKQRWIFELDERGWNVSAANADVVFIDALIDRLAGDICLDLARVYLTGFSNGGLAATALACTLGERIAAIAPVAGFLDFVDACLGTRPVPMLAFFGAEDPVLPFEGGLPPGTRAIDTEAGVPLGALPMAADPVWAVPVPQRAANIAARYGCAAAPTRQLIAEQVERIKYTCPADADVALVVVLDGGHTWPGALEIDASRMMWDFFAQHPLPAQ